MPDLARNILLSVASSLLTLSATFGVYRWCRPKRRLTFLQIVLTIIALCDITRALPGEVSLWVDGANGDDLNDCTELQPCKEIQGAVSKIPGIFAWIRVRPWSGTYGAVDLNHHKTVTVTGDCDDPSQVKVGGLIAQDFVVLAVQCLSTPSVAARQHAVLDVDRVHFLETSGYHSNATVSSQINYVGGVGDSSINYSVRNNRAPAGGVAANGSTRASTKQIRTVLRRGHSPRGGRKDGRYH